MQKWIAYDHLSDMSNMKVAFVNSLIYGDMSTYNIDELKSMDKVTSVDELKKALIDLVSEKRSIFNAQYETRQMLMESPAPTKTLSQVPKRKSLFAEWANTDDSNKENEFGASSAIIKLKEKKRMRSGESDQEQSKKQKNAVKALSFEKLAASEQASTSDSDSPPTNSPPPLEDADLKTEFDFNQTFTIREKDDDVTDFNELVEDENSTVEKESPTNNTEMRKKSSFVRCPVCSKRLSKDSLQQHQKDAHSAEKECTTKKKFGSAEKESTEKEFTEKNKSARDNLVKPIYKEHSSLDELTKSDSNSEDSDNDEAVEEPSSGNQIQVTSGELVKFCKPFSIYVERISSSIYENYGYKKINGIYQKESSKDAYVFGSDSDDTDRKSVV